MILWKRQDSGEMFDAFTMKLDDLPRAGPDALPAIGASLVDDADFRLQQLDGILGANADTAPAKIAFSRDDVDHQWRGTFHRTTRVSLFLIVLKSHLTSFRRKPESRTQWSPKSLKDFGCRRAGPA